MTDSHNRWKPFARGHPKNQLAGGRCRIGAFPGEHIHFGSGRFGDWGAVVAYLVPEEG